MIHLTVELDKSTIQAISKMPDDLKTGVKNGLKKAAKHLERKVKQRFGTSGNLKVKTGRLRSSVKSGVEGDTAWVGTDVVYGPLHEFGGTIRAKQGGYLKFKIAGQWRFMKEVKVPKRAFLAPTLDSEAGNISNIIGDEMMKMLVGK